MMRKGRALENGNRSVSTTEDREMQRIHSSRRGASFQRGASKGRGLAGIFRRHKSESSVVKSSSLSTDDQVSQSFSERTQSTLSLSLTSRGNDDFSLRFSARTSSSACRFAKSDILKEMVFEDLIENSEECRAEDSGDLHADSQTDAPATVIDAPKELSVSIDSTPKYILHKNDNSALGYLQFPYRDIPSASEFALSLSKPLFVLYSETPGDEDVGVEIFSHPLVVEAIQTDFVPVLCEQAVTPETPVRRTASGRRCRATVDILEASSLESLIDESLFGDNLTRKSVSNAIMKTLQRRGKPVPKYLEILHQGETTMGVEPRTFAIGTRDPTRGEVEFASLEGVLAVQSAVVNRHGACLVTYDPRCVSFSFLLRTALQQSLCDSVYCKGNEERVASQVEFARFSGSNLVILPFPEESGAIQDDLKSKEALRKTPMRFVPLTPVQSGLANQLIHQGRFNEATHLLSPFQGQILMRAMRIAASRDGFFDVVNVPIELAWQSVSQQKHPSLVLRKLSTCTETISEGESYTDVDDTAKDF